MSNIIDLTNFDELPMETDSFEVVDMKSADWCIAKIGEAKRRIQERTAIVAEYKKRLDERLAETNIADVRQVDFMESLLRPWAELEIMKGKTKSLKLPCGTLGLRAGRESVVIDDEAAAIEWAELFKPEAVKITKTIYKSEINGTDAPGYHVETGAHTFYVKPDAGLFKLEE
jgi:phage host-nuclease inhibitor protein Gam